MDSSEARSATASDLFSHAGDASGDEEYRAILAETQQGFALGEVLPATEGGEDDFRLLDMNAAFELHTGVSRSLLGMAGKDWPPGPLRERVARAAGMAGKQPGFEQYCAESGRYYEIDVLQPRPGRFAVLMRDVTRRVQAEQTVQEREYFVRQAVAQMPGLVWTAESRGGLRFVSPRMLQYLGVTDVRRIKAEWIAAIHPEDRISSLAAWQASTEAGQEWTVEYRLRGQDGVYRWFRVSGAPVLDREGRVARWVGICTDIDDLKRAREALQEAERRYRALFNSRSQGIAHCEIICDEWGRPVNYLIKEVNDAYEQIIGLTREEVEGRLVTEVFPDIEQYDFDFIGNFGRLGLECGEGRFELEFPPTQQWLAVYAYCPRRGDCVMIFSDITEQKMAEKDLRRERAQLQAILENAPLLVAVRDLAGRTMVANPAFFGLAGLPPPDRLIGNKISEVYPGEVVRAVLESDAVVLRKGGPLRVEEDVGFKDGTTHRLLTTKFPVRYLDTHEPYGIGIISIDISERRKLELSLRESETRLRTVIENLAEGLIVVDPNGSRLQMNRTALEMHGYPAEHGDDLGEMEELHAVFELTLPDGTLLPYQDWPIPRLLRGETLRDYELWLRHKQQDWERLFSYGGSMVRDGEGRPVMGLLTIRDVTERRRAEQRARDAALHDPLTGLPNRRLVFEYAVHLLAGTSRRHEEGAFLFIDLDRFKPINDLYGHEAGDALLQEIARRLLACVRGEDLVGRIGGDEFVVMLPYLKDEQDAVKVAGSIIQEVSAPVQVAKHELAVSPSVGISFFPRDGQDVDTLIRAADLAMYHAKERGRGNYCVYSSALERASTESSVLESILKRAIDSGGLSLHFQPVVDLRSGEISSVEALLRLKGPDGQSISPERFISVAESAGLIAQLGEWVVNEACRQHKHWQALGLPPISIAINVSPLQFRERTFVSKLADTLRDCGIDPGLFQIEVTESAVMESVGEAIEILNAVKRAGIKVALDDFGTGYSSLSQLSDLPIDKLKVDQSFVKRIEHDRASRAITKAIIALGRTLNLEVVGEGIESEQSFSYLYEHGCDLGQGYLFSRPLTTEEFSTWYRGLHGAAA